MSTGVTAVADLTSSQPVVRRTQPACRLCNGGDLFEVADFGPQPIAQRFVSDQGADEYVHPLTLHCCATCGLIQILDPIDPDLLYQEEQYYLSSSKAQPSMIAEAHVIRDHMVQGSVLEIGCNDGTFLELLRDLGFRRCVGLEPNPHTRGVKATNQIAIHSGYFTDEVCHELQAQYGAFEFVAARGVLEHIADISGFLRRSRALLSDGGYLYLMLPETEPFLEQGDCTIALEQHVNYFGVSLMRDMLWQFGFEPVSVQQYNYGGGVIGILGKKISAFREDRHGADIVPAARAFRPKMEAYGRRLRQVLSTARERSWEVVLYGVGWRGCILVNAFHLTDFVSYALDDRADRQGKFMPGSKLPIRPASAASDGTGPLVCLLAVNDEHEAAVSQRLRSTVRRELAFASIGVPKDILQELDALERAVSSR